MDVKKQRPLVIREDIQDVVPCAVDEANLRITPI